MNPSDRPANPLEAAAHPNDYGGNGAPAEAQALDAPPVRLRDEAGHGESDLTAAELPQVRTWGVVLATGVIIAAFVGLFLLGWIPRQKRLARLDHDVQAVQDERPMVQIAVPKHTAPSRDLLLPADARSFQETSIFPRATGYLKHLMVDIGDHVDAGQLLAEIDTPDLDADLNQAKAQLAQAQANVGKAQQDYSLAQTTLKRYEDVGPNGGVTQQELDERRSAYTQAQSALEAARANVKAADANVQRLTALQEFKRVTAPFAGTITARNYDVGALMTPSNTSPGKELFRIADTGTLRVFVNVPQTYVTSIKTGQKAELMVRNYPGVEFDGIVTRTAGTLDPATRTLRYEIEVPNKDGRLFAGMYAQARLTVRQSEPPIVVPTSALVFDADGTKVWIVDSQNRASEKKVKVGRDYGIEVEIAQGLSGSERVITNPGERLAEGGQVQLGNGSAVAEDEKAAPSPPAEPSGEAPRPRDQREAAAR